MSISKFNTKRDVKNEEKTKSQSSLAKAEAKGRQDVSELDAKESTGDLEPDAGLNPGEHGFWWVQTPSSTPEAGSHRELTCA